MKDPLVNTIEAAGKMKEENEKRLQRAQKYGLITKDVVEAKRQERAVKFGLAG